MAGGLQAAIDPPLAAALKPLAVCFCWYVIHTGSADCFPLGKALLHELLWFAEQRS